LTPMELLEIPGDGCRLTISGNDNSLSKGYYLF